jgi:lysophospholipase
MSKRLTDHFQELNLPPDNWREDFFTNARGERLRYGHAPAAPDTAPRGTIVMTHGYGEHIELYHHAIRFYQKRGFDVWMMEWQGHGKSDREDPAAPGGHDPVCNDTCGKPHRPGPRGMLSHMKDLERFVNDVVKPDRRLPVVMSTNSMGGHIGLLAMKYNPAMFDGAILSTPMFDIARLGLPPSFRGVMRTIFNAVAATPFADRQLPGNYKILNWLSGIGQNQSEKKNDDNIRAEWNEATRRQYSDLQIDRPTFAWVSSAYDTIVPSLKDSFLKSVKTPMLIGSAGKDNLVDNAAHIRAAQLSPNTEILHLPTAHHSLWFENNGNYASWTDRIDAFLSRVAPVRAVTPTAETSIAAAQRPALPLAA